MGIFDEAKNLAEEHGDVVQSGIGKAEDIIDEKTGGKFTDQINQGGDLVEKQLGVDSSDDQQDQPQSQDQSGEFGTQQDAQQGAPQEQGQF